MSVTSDNETDVKLRGVESVHGLLYNYWIGLHYWLERKISMLFFGQRVAAATPIPPVWGNCLVGIYPF